MCKHKENYTEANSGTWSIVERFRHFLVFYAIVKEKRPEDCGEAESPAFSRPLLLEDYTSFLMKTSTIFLLFHPHVFSVWTTASYLWTMWMWGRWHTVKLWRLLRKQVLSSASMFSAGNRLQRKSLKSNSSKGLKVHERADGCVVLMFWCGLKTPI